MTDSTISSKRFCRTARISITLLWSNPLTTGIAWQMSLKSAVDCFALRIQAPSVKSNLKASDDRSDAQYLAERLRVGSLKHYLPLNYSSRALRDLCRYRMAMVQDCASLKIKLINLYRNPLSKNVRVADLLERCQPHMQPNYRFNSDILEEFKDPNIRLRVALKSLALPCSRK